jgi:hypothetical protein
LAATRAEATISPELARLHGVKAGLGRAAGRSHLDTKVHGRLTGGGEERERTAKSLADESNT